jgi:hypothetical protein
MYFVYVQCRQDPQYLFILGTSGKNVVVINEFLAKFSYFKSYL